jgi:putative endonuclease
MPYFVYILRCADNTLYTGLTTDLQRRLSEHQESPKGARYTRSRRPVCLAWQSEALPNRAEAAALEWKIKRLSSRQKQKWIETS